LSQEDVPWGKIPVGGNNYKEKQLTENWTYFDILGKIIPTIVHCVRQQSIRFFKSVLAAIDS
jgi:hypothetical protein